jgi:hypothetical protein
MKTLLTRTISLPAFLVLANLLLGQGTASDPSRVALRVDGLTHEERDQLSNDLQERGDLRISFACVPAGILILEPLDPERSADSVRAMAATALIRRLPAQRRNEVALSLHEAEALCETSRNQ